MEPARLHHRHLLVRRPTERHHSGARTAQECARAARTPTAAPRLAQPGHAPHPLLARQGPPRGEQRGGSHPCSPARVCRSWHAALHGQARHLHRPLHRHQGGVPRGGGRSAGGRPLPQDPHLDRHLDRHLESPREPSARGDRKSSHHEHRRRPGQREHRQREHGQRDCGDGGGGGDGSVGGVVVGGASGVGSCAWCGSPSQGWVQVRMGWHGQGRVGQLEGGLV
mmetsp:Transcript_9396/g.19231  ORF Transcript_9396/g.19231 Transcript_9396/m.19231 type:complete len:224 (-) Transcript_9396:350-1021(-)